MTHGHDQHSLWESREHSEKDFRALVADAGAGPRARLLLDALPPSGPILEAGCGDGAFVFFLRSLGREAFGVDFAQSAVDHCRRLASASGAAPPDAFLTGDVTRLDLPDASYNAYISMGVLEHFPDGGRAALREAFRILRPGGILFVTVPNLFSPRTPVRALRTLVRPSLRQKNVSRFTLRRRVRAAGFQPLRTLNLDVPASFNAALSLHAPTVRGIPNPFHHLRRPILALARLLDRLLPILGYHSVCIARKPNAS